MFPDLANDHNHHTGNTRCTIPHFPILWSSTPAFLAYPVYKGNKREITVIYDEHGGREEKTNLPKHTVLWV